MSGGIRRLHNKSRSSKRFCEEKFACNGVRTEAAFNCEDCGTHQCTACEAKLHDFPKFKYHDRRKLEPPPDHLICQSVSCEDRNYADVRCEECKFNFCFACDASTHSAARTGRKRNHKRVLYTDYLSEQAVSAKHQEPSKSPDDSRENSPDDSLFLTIGPVSDTVYSKGTNGQRLPQPQVASHPRGHLVDLNAAILDLDVPRENTIPGHPDVKGSTPHQHHPGFAEPVAKNITDKEANFSKDIGFPAHIAETPVKSRVAHVNQPVSHPCQYDTEKDNFQSLSSSTEDQFYSLFPARSENFGQELTPADSYFSDKRQEPIGELSEDFKDIDEELSNCVIDQGSSESMDLISSNRSIPDIALSSMERSEGTGEDIQKSYVGYRSFPLVDEQEELQVANDEEFLARLDISKDTEVKVVSIFGNTGDGKSHTLNHTFFYGEEVFRVSPCQSSCTIGVWCAYNRENKIIIIDTEGFLGTTSNENQRTRLLLKILAISDVVIYRTKVERLHKDMFVFLGNASKSYLDHFSKELIEASDRWNMAGGQLSRLGPAVIIFHETQRTDLLGAGFQGQEFKNKISNEINKRFKDARYERDAFSAVQYVGTKTESGVTDFRKLLDEVKKQVQDTSVRAPRPARVVYKALEALNRKFSGDIEAMQPNAFPDEYFTCTSKCLSCQARCTKSMNHTKDEGGHDAGTGKACIKSEKYNNMVFTCKQCFVAGRTDNVVIPKTSSYQDNTWIGLAKFAWSGYVLECPQHGVIYRSRQYWYGNEEPDKEAVRTEIRHVWPGGRTVLQGSHNAARKLLDGVTYISDTVTNVSAKPTKMLSAWVADQIAPAYWIPNSEIIKCTKCDKLFEESDTKHHCRACGKGFCDACSTRKMPVPERGWGEIPVRVCDGCADGITNNDGDEPQVTARRVSEKITYTMGFMKSVMDYPKDLIKDSARPDYWEPDSEITECCVCSEKFSVKLRLHHCRCCGRGVCDGCSPVRRSVPSRGWDEPVRICQTCNAKKGPL